MSDDKPAVLNRDTLVPIGAVIAVFSMLFGSHTWLNGQFLALRMEISTVGNRLERLEELGSQRWTKADQREWALTLANANKGLVVPGVDR